MPSVKLRSFGGIDTDSDIQDIKNGRYPSAKNIDHVKSSDGDTFAITPRIGNTLSFDLGVVNPQNKAYLFQFPEEDSGENYSFSIYKTDRVTKIIEQNPAFASSEDFQPGGVIQTYLDQNGFLVSIQQASEVFPSITSDKAWILEVVPAAGYEIPDYYEYYIENEGNLDLEISVIKEAITESRGGELEVIGSFDLLGDLFIFSTPQNKKSQKLKINNIFVLNAGVLGQGVSSIDVFFGELGEVYDVQNQTEVFLTGISSPAQLNGVYNATIIQTPTTLPDGTPAIEYRARITFLSLPIGPLDFIEGFLTLNAFGLGEVGVAVKDKVKEEWSYTRLLRSKELDWATFRQKELRGQISLDRRSIYFTGNPFGVFYYKESQQYVQDGAIKSIYEDGYYTYGAIANQVKLQPSRANIRINLNAQLETSGSLLSGNIIYFARGVLADGTPSDWSLPSQEVPVYSALTSTPAGIKGDEPGVQSSKANEIILSGIDSDLYSYVEVAAVQKLAIGIDTTTYGIFAREAVSPGVTSITVIHNGNEVPVTLQQAELDVETEFYSSAENINIIRNRLVLADLTIDTIDISDFLSTIKYSLQKKEISYSGTTAYFSKFGGSQDPLNVFNYSGYMLNETYRISARVVLTNGTSTEIEKVFDVTIDTNQTSTDGKRISGLDNYDLTKKVVVNTLPNGTEVYEIKDLVPYIRIEGLDFDNYLINGIPARSIIERIEFFRAEVDTPSITGYGYAVMHVECATTELIGKTPNNPDTPPVYRASISPTQRASIIYSTPGAIIENQGQVTPNQGVEMVSYEFPFINRSQASLPSGVFPFSFNQTIPGFLNYNDPSFTMNAGPLVGKDAGYSWNDRFCSIYLSSNFSNSGTPKIQPGDTIISYGAAARDNIYDTGANNSPSNYSARFYSDGFVNKEEVKVEESLLISPGESVYMTDRWVTKAMGQITDPDLLPSTFIQDVNNVPKQSGGVGGGPFDMFVVASEFYIIVSGPGIGAIIGSGGTGFPASLGVTGFINAFNSTNPLGMVAEGDGATGIYFYAPVNSTAWQQAQIQVRSITFFGSGVSNLSTPFDFSVEASVEAQRAFMFNPGYVARLPQTLDYNLNQQTADDNGVRFIQVKKAVSPSDQYPDSQPLRHVYTGASVSPEENLNTVDLFGGDTLTTQQLVRHLTKTANDYGSITGGMTQGVCVTMQSKKNIPLCYSLVENDFFPGAFPAAGSLTTNMTSWLEKQELDPYNYNEGYSIENLGVGYVISYAADFRRPKKLISRIIWSDLKPLSANTDFFRRIAPASYKDLDPSAGRITGLIIIDGELFTMQPKSFQKQYFDTGGTIRTEDGSEIVIGDPSVMSRSGRVISTYGSGNKWSIIVGKSNGGGDVCYWYEGISKKMMRFGGDGTVPISDRSLARAGIIDATRWILKENTPAHDYGIHGVWNQLLFEATWTVRAARYKIGDGITKEWKLNTAYTAGEVIYNAAGGPFVNFEKTDVFFIVKQNHTSSIDTRPGLGALWEDYYTRVTVNDSGYFSFRTMTFNEVKNSFTQLDESPHPKIYLQWEDTYLSPRTKSPFSLIYEHNIGNYLFWYDYNGDAQSEDGYIDVVFNIEQNRSKRYIALTSNSEVVPYKVSFFTKAHETVVDSASFTWILDQYFVPIPNNLNNGQTLTDNTELFGQWIKVRFFFKPEEYQKLINLMVKFTMLPIDYNI